jgi:hypothetical protein
MFIKCSIFNDELLAKYRKPFLDVIRVVER